VSDAPWQPVTVPKLIGFCGGVVLFLFLLFNSEPGFIIVLDSANLLFHEAGHPLYGMFSSRLAVYGGTLGQLTFPVVLLISFWRKREAIPCAVSGIWFFENWLNIARYMGDARTVALPLVGGGDHDWNEIFFRWNLLSSDTLIAGIFRTAGWIGMGASVVWILWRATRDRKTLRELGERNPISDQ
jgi:hypothetical protein